MTSILLSTVHGYNRPRCDSHGYGKPQPDFCHQLILNEIPIDNRLTRLFSLRTSIKPEDITKAQWSERVELPFLRKNGQYSRLFQVCCRQLMTILDGCGVALLAVRFLNGSISYDISTWEEIRDDTQRLKRSCGGFTVAPLGGNLVVGEFVHHTEEVMAYHCLHRSSFSTCPHTLRAGIRL